MKKELLNPVYFDRKQGQNYMTVGEMKQHLNDYDDNDIIILAKDSECNGYSPLSDGQLGLYRPDSTWSGEVLCCDNIEEMDEIEIQKEINQGKLIKCVVFYPIN